MTLMLFSFLHCQHRALPICGIKHPEVSSQPKSQTRKSKEEIREEIKDIYGRLPGENSMSLAKRGTPWHEAALGGDWESLELLKQYGVDINQRNTESKLQLTALQTLANKNPLRDGGNPEKSKKAAKKRLKTVELLISYGVDVNLKSPKVLFGNDVKTTRTGSKPGEYYGGDETALHLAAAQGHIDIVMALVEKGEAMLNEKNFLGQTPLYIALERENYDVFDYLVQAGASIDEPDKAGWTPLRLAYRDLESVEILLKAGANINLKDPLGVTPLHWYANNDFDGGAVKLLLKQDKIEIDPVNKLGATPLHLAAWKGNPVSVEALVKAGANKNKVGTIQYEDPRKRGVSNLMEVGTPLQLAKAALALKRKSGYHIDPDTLADFNDTIQFLEEN